MIGSAHLTTAPVIAAAQAGTYPGMAHFAGTGPAGRMCFECAFFTPRRKMDEASPGRCGKYSTLVGRGRHVADRRFPRNASACRHFETSVTSESNS